MLRSTRQSRELSPALRRYAHPVPLSTERAASNASPLWIIALFIGLTEVVSGVVAAQSTGAAATALVAFVIGFPILVFFTFVWMLVKHPGNLYSPSQFGSIAPTDFVAALTRSAHERQVVLRHAISNAVADLSSTAPSFGGLDASELRTRLETEVERHIKASSVEIEVSSIDPDAPSIEVPITAETTVASFLDTVYFLLARKVPPFSYARSWLLVTESNVPLLEMGTSWARSQGMLRDERPLAAVGVHGGTLLRAVPAGGKGTRVATDA